jgi:hypothetical protein
LNAGVVIVEPGKFRGGAEEPLQTPLYAGMRVSSRKPLIEEMFGIVPLPCDATILPKARLGFHY